VVLEPKKEGYSIDCLVPTQAGHPADWPNGNLEANNHNSPVTRVTRVMAVKMPDVQKDRRCERVEARRLSPVGGRTAQRLPAVVQRAAGRHTTHGLQSGQTPARHGPDGNVCSQSQDLSLSHPFLSPSHCGERWRKIRWRCNSQAVAMECRSSG
jgi:hypothetical protein